MFTATLKQLLEKPQIYIFPKIVLNNDPLEGSVTKEKILHRNYVSFV